MEGRVENMTHKHSPPKPMHLRWVKKVTKIFTQFSLYMYLFPRERFHVSNWLLELQCLWLVACCTNKYMHILFNVQWLLLHVCIWIWFLIVTLFMASYIHICWSKKCYFPALVHMPRFARDVLNIFKAQCRPWFNANTKEFDLLRVLYKTWQRSNPLPHQLSQHQSLNC